VAVGEPLSNVGITAAERTLSPEDGRGTISLALVNHAGSPSRRRITVSAAGKEVLARDLDVAPGVSSLTLPLPPGLPPVHVALQDDELARDNDVILAEPRPRIVAVETRLPEGRGRDALLRALGALSGVTASESPHLAFVEAADLEGPGSAGVWRAGFGRPPASWRATGDPEDLVGPFLLEKRHPLLLGASFGGVVWSGAMPLAAGAVRPLASAGDRTLIGTPTPPRGDPAFFFNLDLDGTNLVRAPDWPILISNVVEMRRQSLPGPERWNYRAGEWVRVRLGRDPQGELRIRGGGIERTLPAGRQLEFMAPAPGLLQILEGDNVLYELGVNFLDATESDLRGQAAMEVGELPDVPDLRAETGASSDPLFWILLAIAAAAMIGNWHVLRRAHPQSALRV
jgi:hypothetical protein